MQNKEKTLRRMLAKILAIVLIAGIVFVMVPVDNASAATKYGLVFCSYTGDSSTNENGEIQYQSTVHETQYVPEGSTATRPQTPTRDGFIFDNWYTDNSFSTLFDFSAPVTQAKAVYGRWIKPNVQFIAYDETNKKTGGGKITVTGKMPGSSATKVGPSASFTQNLYDDYSYRFDCTPNSGYYFKGWSINSLSNAPRNYVDYTTTPSYLNQTHGDLKKVYAVFSKYGNATTTWNAYENKSSEFRKEYFVNGPGIEADGLYVLEDKNNITETHWEGLTSDGKLPNSGNAKFVITLKGNVPLGSYKMVLTDKISHKIYDVTLVVKHRTQKWLPLEPTCSSNGYKTYWECLECGKCFSDEACTVETTKEAMKIAPLGHNYGAWQYLNETQHRRYCTRDDKHTETKSHTWNAGVVTTEPTTTHTGVKTFTCSGCGGTKTESIPAIVVPSSITITKHPVSKNVNVGDIINLSVTATGKNLTYKWQYTIDGSKWIDSAVPRKGTVQFTANKSFNGRKYRCIVSDGKNTVISNLATIKVNTPLAITENPKSQSTFVGKRIELSVKAEGNNLTYKWQYRKDGQAWTDSAVEKKATVGFTAIKAFDGREYRCIVSDGNTTMISDSAIIKVKTPLAITRSPKSQVAHVGEKIILSVIAKGDNLTYKWQYSRDGKTWIDSAVGRKATVQFTAKQAFNGRRYRCVVSDGTTIINSDVAVIAVVN